MAWLRLDDGFTKHPKFEGWPPARRWAWLEVMEYCARYETNGRIPRDLSLLPKSTTETLLKQAEEAGWIDRDPQGNRWIHDFKKYNPSDPGKAARQARWRDKRRRPVDDDVDAQECLPERLPRARAAAPVPVPSPGEFSSTAAAGPIPPLTPPTAPAAAAAALDTAQLSRELTEIGVGLREVAKCLEEPERAQAWLEKARLDADSRPAGYIWKGFKSGSWPEGFREPTMSIETVSGAVERWLHSPSEEALEYDETAIREEIAKRERKAGVTLPEGEIFRLIDLWADLRASRAGATVEAKEG